MKESLFFGAVCAAQNKTQRRIIRVCNLDYNLVAGPRFEVNARGIIPRDDKIQTSYEEPLDQRAEFYALKRCPRDARGARARSV